VTIATTNTTIFESGAFTITLRATTGWAPNGDGRDRDRRPAIPPQ